MNFLFEFHKTYVLPAPQKEVTNQMQYVGGKWWNWIVNITGKVNEDGTFTFYPK